MNHLSFLIDPDKVDQSKKHLDSKYYTAKNYEVIVSKLYAKITILEISNRQSADIASTLERNGIQIDIL